MGLFQLVISSSVSLGPADTALIYGYRITNHRLSSSILALLGSYLAVYGCSQRLLLIYLWLQPLHALLHFQKLALKNIRHR